MFFISENSTKIVLFTSGEYNQLTSPPLSFEIAEGLPKVSSFLGVGINSPVNYLG